MVVTVTALLLTGCSQKDDRANAFWNTCENALINSLGGVSEFDTRNNNKLDVARGSAVAGFYDIHSSRTFAFDFVSLGYTTKIDRQTQTGAFKCTFLINDPPILTRVEFDGQRIDDPETLKRLAGLFYPS